MPSTNDNRPNTPLNGVSRPKNPSKPNLTSGTFTHADGESYQLITRKTEFLDGSVVIEGYTQPVFQGGDHEPPAVGRMRLEQVRDGLYIGSFTDLRTGQVVELVAQRNLELHFAEGVEPGLQFYPKERLTKNGVASSSAI